ncbi:hypothetical protein EVAR_2962_1 [Eumeta japonica]|uniref:Uncharacterized protein n=1 Tax=Eumeta variegata TaxID=151549 RepID=A0A4C1T0Y3_EUMVA|nr:hypothetical protein EVAR_2962_1 [Eumeta japonica]
MVRLDHFRTAAKCYYTLVSSINIIERQTSMQVSRYKWSPLPKDTRDSGRVTIVLTDSVVEIEYLLEEGVG